MTKKTQKKSKIKPTIGIIGGCGPIAAVDIEKEILFAAQKIMRPLIDQDYPNIIVYQYTQFYDRNDAECFYGKSPYVQYLECANKLISIGADILLFACNTAHIYLDALKKKIKVPIINMIEEVAMHTKKLYPDITKIGLLSTEATYEAGLYQQAFKPYNVIVVGSNNSIKKQIMKAIYLIKAGNCKIRHNNNLSHISRHPYKKILLQMKDNFSVNTLNKAVEYLLYKGCNHIVLGCTELPLLMNEISNNKAILINPNKIVAEEVIRTIMKKL